MSSVIGARGSGLGARWWRVLRFSEAIADAANGVNVARFAAARLQAPPNPLHERVDAADGDESAAAPDLCEQRVAAEHAPRMPRQQIEQLEFLLGDLDVAAADAHPPPVRIDVEIVD